MEKLDREKIAAIYAEANNIVRKGLRSGKSRAEITKELNAKVKEIVDNEN